MPSEPSGVSAARHIVVAGEPLGQVVQRWSGNETAVAGGDEGMRLVGRQIIPFPGAKQVLHVAKLNDTR